MAGITKYLYMALALVFGLIGLRIFLSVAQSVIPGTAAAYYDLANSYNETVVGTSAQTLATTSPEWLGFVWVILPFAAAAMMILKVFRSN